jgi:hypothetical protein
MPSATEPHDCAVFPLENTAQYGSPPGGAFFRHPEGSECLPDTIRVSNKGEWAPTEENPPEMAPRA